MRGETAINLLYEACKLHDIGYSQYENIIKSHKADKVLEESVSKWLKSSNSNIGGKMAAPGVKRVMKINRKMRMGMTIKKRVVL